MNIKLLYFCFQNLKTCRSCHHIVLLKQVSKLVNNLLLQCRFRNTLADRVQDDHRYNIDVCRPTSSKHPRFDNKFAVLELRFDNEMIM